MLFPREVRVIPLNVISELFDYNYWARDRQYDVCKGLTRRQFNQEMQGSFPSLRQTLTHMAQVEWLWLERWQGRSPERMPPDDALNTADQIQDYMRRVEHSTREFFVGVTEEQLRRPLSYTNFAGEVWTYPMWRTVMHVINHQSYHRGQVTNYLRDLGMKAPLVDFLAAHDAGFRVAAKV